MEENRPMTKKELKAMRRAEKMNAYKEENKQNMVKWVIIGLASFVFLAFFGFLIFLVKQNNPVSSDTPAQISSETGWSMGAEDSKVTLVEYGDFQCPACQAYHPIVKEVLAGYEEGQVRFIFKHFPLISIHPLAMSASRAAEAAGMQGKFFEYHDLLFERQATWSGLNAADADARFVAFAEELELDIEKFNQDRKSSETEAKVRETMDEGAAAGASGTPSFFVNGVKINNPQSVDEFREIINAELQ